MELLHLGWDCPSFARAQAGTSSTPHAVSGSPAFAIRLLPECTRHRMLVMNVQLNSYSYHLVKLHSETQNFIGVS